MGKGLRWFWGICVLWLSLGVSAAVQYIDIWEFRVQGNSLLADEVIQRELAPYLGAARTLEDVEQAAKLLQDLYKKAGYPAVFVEIPPQTVVQGVFRLQVTETRLRRLRVTGAEYFLPSLIKQALPSLQTGNALNLRDLQQDIQYANALNPDLKLMPMLKQGPTADTIEVELNVDDEMPVSAGVEVNNYNSPNTTNTRLIAELGYSNLWQKLHDWSIQMQTSPENTDEVKVLASTYVFPMGLKGNKVALYGVLSDSDVATVGSTRVVGDGFILGGRYIHPFQRRDTGVSTLIFGFDYKDFDEQIRVTGAEGLETPIDYVVFTSQYSSFNRGDGWADNLGLALKFGVREVFNENEEFDNKRSRSEPNFTILKLDYERNYFLGEGWSLLGAMTGQWSSAPLVSNEQMSAGGVDSVRGYYESQVAADMGMRLSFEMGTPSYAGKHGEVWGLTFVEGAYLENSDTGVEEDSEFRLASFGFGLRAQSKKQWFFDLDAGYPLKAVDEVEEGDVRVNAKLRYEY
ncbi:ShlB/FhaC/HecB family hemolysin secretion/activation protein [Ketobacter sp.]|uniref:ShlB/FhaC/HecB family hemolysin secretion/activation protein n=1 Tax=Ketobacter sp. TaxID=2083498 RepID=UPI000F11F936|nr:POTRA domain-containing protein [Ketobacter sp.]RLU01142.1 MAG: ShlB/FhaC/HecB family hemolysin secretion/activation protein [Ketobacter sp.]